MENLKPKIRVKKVSTAYVGKAATKYDELRFVNKHGLVFHELELNQIKNATSKMDADTSILEVGCGTARFSLFLAQKGFKVVAIDPSEDMLKIAKEKCENLKNVEFSLMEGAKLDFSNNSFDFIFAVRVLNQTVSETYALNTIKEMIRVSKNNGTILVEFANKSRPLVQQNNSVKLTFKQIEQIAELNKCVVIKKAGVLIFSQTILDKIPSFLLPLWKKIELISGRFLWCFASRGYILLKKINK